MKRANLVLVFFLVFPLVSPCMISVEEAAQKIREFEGNPSYPLRYIGLDYELTEEQMGGTGPKMPWPCYFFVKDDPQAPMNVCYFVDPYTGQIIFRWDRHTDFGILSHQEGNISNMITPQQAYEIAKNFILAHNPDVNLSNYEVLISFPQLTPSGGVEIPKLPYSPNLIWQLYWADIYFIFQKRLKDANGNLSWQIGDEACTFQITMDSETGKIGQYLQRRYPINVASTPQISGEQAEQMALGAFNSPPYSPYVSYAEVEKKELNLMWNDVPPNCFALIWRVYVKTYTVYDEYRIALGTQEAPRIWEVVIDANSGEIYRVMSFLGSAGKVSPSKEQREKFKKAPRVQIPWLIIEEEHNNIIKPIQYKGKFFIEDWQAGSLGVRVIKEGDSVFLLYKNRKAKLSKADVLSKNGKLFVSLDSVMKISDYQAKYVSKGRTIYLQRKNVKEEKAKGILGGTLSLSALSYALWKFLRILA